MDRHHRFCWDIVQRCESRDAANCMIDELRSAVAKAKKRLKRSTGASRGEKWPR